MAEPSDVSRTSFDRRAVQQAGAGSVRQGTGPGKARVKRRTTQLGDGGEIALAAVAPPLRRHYPGSDDYQIAAAHRPVRHLSRLLRPTRSPRIGELRTYLSRKFRRIGGDTRMAGSYSPPVGWTGVNSTLLPGKDGPPIALPTALQRCTVMPRSARWGHGKHLAARNHEVVRMARMPDLGKSCLEGSLEHGSRVAGTQLKPGTQTRLLIIGRIVGELDAQMSPAGKADHQHRLIDARKLHGPDRAAQDRLKAAGQFPAPMRPREDMHIAAKSDHDVARPFPADLRVIRGTLLSSRYILQRGQITTSCHAAAGTVMRPAWAALRYRTLPCSIGSMDPCRSAFRPGPRQLRRGSRQSRRIGHNAGQSARGRQLADGRGRQQT